MIEDRRIYRIQGLEDGLESEPEKISALRSSPISAKGQSQRQSLHINSVNLSLSLKVSQNVAAPCLESSHRSRALAKRQDVLIFSRIRRTFGGISSLCAILLLGNGHPEPVLILVFHTI